MVKIVLHAILFQPFEHQSLYIRPSEMLLSNEGRMVSGAKIAIQIPKMYIYLTPLLCFMDNNCGIWPSENHV